jgi:hypothetical protein
MAKPHFFMMTALIAGCASLALRIQSVGDQQSMISGGKSRADSPR